jgi:hypothetical protein
MWARNGDVFGQSRLYSRVATRTYRTEPAITRHFLYLLVKKGIIPAMSGVPDGRNREGNTSITAKIGLFWRFKGTMTSYRSFRAAGPYKGTRALAARAFSSARSSGAIGLTFKQTILSASLIVDLRSSELRIIDINVRFLEGSDNKNLLIYQALLPKKMASS